MRTSRCICRHGCPTRQCRCCEHGDSQRTGTSPPKPGDYGQTAILQRCWLCFEVAFIGRADIPKRLHPNVGAELRYGRMQDNETARTPGRIAASQRKTFLCHLAGKIIGGILFRAPYNVPFGRVPQYRPNSCYSVLISRPPPRKMGRVLLQNPVKGRS